jgi:hypothetical protein
MMKLLAAASVTSALVLLPLPALAQGYGQPPPAQPGLESGGLTPPSGPVQTEPIVPPTPTEQELAEADREDSGRGLEFFWLNGEIGFEHLGMQTFKANDLVDADVVKTTHTGLAFGAGLGVRLVFITLGARFRLANFEIGQLWTLNAELGLRIPLGDLEPYFTFGGGYASLGSFGGDNIGDNFNDAGVEIRGYNVRGGFGMDYYLSDAFSIGANLTGELLGLTRPGVDPSKLQASGSASGDPNQLKSEVYATDGSGIGAAVTGTAVVGLHF